MNRPKYVLILGLIGFAVFYLVASGCGTLGWGGIKTQVDSKIAACPNKTIGSVYLSFTTQEIIESFEKGLKDLLVRNGYQLVPVREKADLELQVQYKAFVTAHTEIYIFFFIPSFNSYPIHGFEAKATFKSNHCDRNAFYRARDESMIHSAILTDLEQFSGR